MGEHVLRDHGLWPAAGTRRLLQAALLPGPAAAAAFAAWRASAPPPAELDSADWRLLPLVARKLGGAGDYDALSADVRRRAEARNAMLLRGAAEAIATLRAAGCDGVLALKGLPLLLEHYRDPALRPMSDVDLMVRPRDRARALAALRAAGWVVDRPVPEGLAPWMCAFDCKRAGGLQVDLHQYLIEYGSSPEVEDGLWRRAHALDVLGERCLAPGATDLLLHVCLASLKSGRTVNSRWVADACVVLDGAAIDWELLVAEARRRRAAAPLRECLQYLVDGFGVAVPARTLAALWAVPVDAAQRRRYRVLTRETRTSRSPGQLVEEYLSLYAFGADASGARRSPWGFARFASDLLAYRWQLPDRRHLPRAVASRLATRLLRR